MSIVAMGRSSLLGCPPRRDLAPPRAALGPALLDQALEALEVAADAARVEAGGGADRFAQSLRLVAHAERDACARVADRLERHRAARLLSVLADPADLAIGMLLEDLRVPLRVPAG